MEYNCNGKVYKIEPVCEHDEGDLYIGSTFEVRLSRRMDKHRSGYKAWKSDNVGGHVRSYDLFDKCGIENCHIILIETVYANSRDELELRESYYIQICKCVNKLIPMRGKKLGKSAYNKLYYKENMNRIQQNQKKYSKTYQSKHKEYIRDYWKIYEIENKEHLDEYRMQYREKNKNKINLKITCPFCNCNLTKRHLKLHEQSLKHLKNASLYTVEYEYQWDDGTPCTEQEHNDAMGIKAPLVLLY